MLIEEAPDVIISVHPLTQHIPIYAMRSLGIYEKVPFITVVTDYASAHPSWVSLIVKLLYRIALFFYFPPVPSPLPRIKTFIWIKNRAVPVSPGGTVIG